MPGIITGKIIITLSGDWSMNGVASQKQHLVRQLTSFTESPPDQVRQASATANQPEIVMSGIDELDACGCQLLTMFVHVLKQQGGMPLLTDIPDALREKILYLGFARELGTHFEASEVCV